MKQISLKSNFNPHLSWIYSYLFLIGLIPTIHLFVCLNNTRSKLLTFKLYFSSFCYFSMFFSFCEVLFTTLPPHTHTQNFYIIKMFIAQFPTQASSCLQFLLLFFNSHLSQNLTSSLLINCCGSDKNQCFQCDDTPLAPTNTSTSSNHFILRTVIN